MENGSRLTDLAEGAGFTKQAVGEAVAELERLGYLERAACPDDGRAKIIKLTDRGRDAVPHRPAHVRRDRGRVGRGARRRAGRRPPRGGRADRSSSRAPPLRAGTPPPEPLGERLDQARARRSARPCRAAGRRRAAAPGSPRRSAHGRRRTRSSSGCRSSEATRFGRLRSWRYSTITSRAPVGHGRADGPEDRRAGLVVPVVEDVLQQVDVGPGARASGRCRPRRAPPGRAGRGPRASRRPRPARRARPPARRAGPGRDVEDRGEQRAHAAGHVAEHAVLRPRVAVHDERGVLRGAGPHAAGEHALLLGVLGEPLPDGAPVHAREGGLPGPDRLGQVRPGGRVGLRARSSAPSRARCADGRCAGAARCGRARSAPCAVELEAASMSAAARITRWRASAFTPSRPASSSAVAGPLASSSATPSSARVPIICVRASPTDWSNRATWAGTSRSASAHQPAPRPRTARTANAGGGRPGQGLARRGRPSGCSPRSPGPARRG